ncbi:ABC transporter permease [Spongiimicrobium salis]|uniref:ABC transporter permease n=1 Tax=Spongiimicrobium salis TaxID=1667022 RepID=UPI00374D253F
MFKNYFKIAWRSILKNKVMFSINTLGLAIGIASCLFIMLFVIDELSYDRFHDKADEMVRVVFRAKINNEEIKEGVVMAPVAETLKREFPEVLDATRIRDRGLQKIRLDNLKTQKGNFAYVDPNFFNVFSFPLLEGNTTSPLQNPYSVVLSKKEAIKYFGSMGAAIGKQIYIQDQKEPHTITAIVEDIPRNSHFHFDLFASTVSHEPAKSTSWLDSGFHTYLVLEKGYAPALLESKLPRVLEQHMGSQLQEAMGISYTQFTTENRLGLFLQPITEIHLNSDFSAASQIEQGGDVKYIYIFSAVAVFMLLIACINFMNLSTVTAAKRAKEVGIKKVLGSAKQQLIAQFLAEAFLATTIAMCLAGVLLVLSLPLFNQISGKELQISSLYSPTVGIAFGLLTVVISMLAGGYPAFFLASFKPITALKSKFYSTGNSKGIRSALVVFQFVIATGLIFAILIVNQQMSFMQHKELGYDKDQILVIRDTPSLGINEAAYAANIVKDPRIVNLSKSSYVPAGPSDNSMSGVFLNNEFQRRMFVYNIDENYLPTMGMELLAGRNFSKTFGADSTKVIINESAAKALGFQENALGKIFHLDTKDKRKAVTIIGVVKDFHYRSLHRPIEPLFMQYKPSGGLVVRADVAEMSGLIEHMEAEWNKMGSDEPFQYGLLDEAYQQTYVAEQKMGTVLNIFAVLTIFVACLGLFGLVTFSAQQRFKEIGVRKVLGSSVSQVVSLLSKDFLKLVLISFLLAFPLGSYVMGIWLESFAYRIQIGWPLYLLAAGITLFVAFLTISWKSYRAAAEAPVKSLRTE